MKIIIEFNEQDDQSKVLQVLNVLYSSPSKPALEHKAETQNKALSAASIKKEKVVQSPTAEAEKAKPSVANTVVLPKASASSTSTDDSITIKDLRELMAEKVASHVDTIKEKLSSFGVSNVSTLAKEHYDEFNDFLLALD